MAGTTMLVPRTTRATITALWHTHTVDVVQATTGVVQATAGVLQATSGHGG